MRGKTHIVGGLLVASVIVPQAFADPLNNQQFFPIVGASIVGSLLPDIDSASSTLGKFNLVAGKMKHRGFCHSLLFVLFVAILSTDSFQQASPGACVLTGAMLFHIFLDMLNQKGVQIFWPYKKFFRLPVHGTATGGLGDTAFFVVMAIATYVNIKTGFFTIPL